MTGPLGGGEWIRTTEVVDNRFTVCPLWPLGNSPINNMKFYTRRIRPHQRAPDLLITNQLLYQLSYTSKFLTLDNYSLINKKSQPFFSKFSVKFHFSFQSVEKPSLAPIHCLTYWAGRRRSAVSKGGAVSPDRIQAYHFTGSARPLQNARHCSAS